MFGIIIAVLVISITISLLSVTEAVPKLDDGIEPVSEYSCLTSAHS